jgi:hypothetical protein
MNQTDQFGILASNAAVGREPLARYLVKQPSLTYNQVMRALKSAPRSRGLYSKGKAAATKLLGK